MRSSSRRAPHHDLPAREAVEVEGVQRLAGQQHHVVGDVDDVGDRAHPGGLQAGGHPVRRGTDLHVGEHPGHVARAEVRRLDLEARVVLHPAPPGRRLRLVERRQSAPVTAWTSRATPYIARQSGRLEVISSSSTVSEMGSTAASGVPGTGPSGSSMIPECVVAQRELGRREDHPPALHAAQLRHAERGVGARAAGRRAGPPPRAGPRPRGRAADDRGGLRVAEVDVQPRRRSRSGAARP